MHTLKSPPKRPQHTTYSVIAGEELEIACIASGIPEPKMIWVNIERDQVVSKTHLLRLEQTKASDTGAYICVAKNMAAEVYKQIELAVHQPPKLGAKLRGVDISRLILTYSYRIYRATIH